jgi:hypothetical protein
MPFFVIRSDGWSVSQVTTFFIQMAARGASKQLKYKKYKKQIDDVMLLL